MHMYTNIYDLLEGYTCIRQHQGAQMYTGNSKDQAGHSQQQCTSPTDSVKYYTNNSNSILDSILQ